jgi:hypothetical protein
MAFEAYIREYSIRSASESVLIEKGKWKPFITSALPDFLHASAVVFNGAMWAAYSSFSRRFLRSPIPEEFHFIGLVKLIAQ